MPPRLSSKHTVIAALATTTACLFVLGTVISITENVDNRSIRAEGEKYSALYTGHRVLRGLATAGTWVDHTGTSTVREVRRLVNSVTPAVAWGGEEQSKNSKIESSHPYFTDEDSFVLPQAEPGSGSTPHHGHHAWHKPLHPIDGWDLAGVGFACIGLMIAAAGGIGGGGILVPLYILVLQFHPKHAIPLSNITIFGGAITNTMLNLSKRHPDADRPLVDWDLILVMEPLTIGGALVGSFINKVWRAEDTHSYGTW